MSRAAGLVGRYRSVPRLICDQNPEATVVLLLDTVDGVDIYETFAPKDWDGEPVVEWDSFSIHPVICGGALSDAGLNVLRSHLNQEQIDDLDKAIFYRHPDTVLVVGMSPDDFYIEELRR